MAKKIHFYSLFNQLNAPSEEYLRDVFFKQEVCQRINCCYIGPQFVSTEAVLGTIIEKELIFNGKKLKTILIPDGPVYDCSLGDKKLIEHLLPEETKKALEIIVGKNVYWTKTSILLNDYGVVLNNVHNTILELFGWLSDGDECLVFLTFPFAEIVFEAFCENKNFFIFKEFEGFSLKMEGNKITAGV